jgi:PAS domain S-box-containing protein
VTIENNIYAGSNVMPLPTAEVKFPHAESDAITTGCVLMLDVDLKVRNLLAIKGMEYQYFDEVTSNQQMFSEMVQMQSKIDAIVMGVQIKEPVSLAQRIHAINKDIPILILTEPERYKQVKQALAFTPFLSNEIIPWSTDEMNQLKEALQDTVKRKQKRHSYKKSIAAVQLRLADVYHKRPQVKHYLDRLLDHVPIGVLNVDIQGSVLGLNRFASQILNSSEREVIGASFTEIFPASERETLRDLIAQCVAPARHRTPQVFDISETVGKIRYVEVMASSLVDSSGQLGATVLLQDVTARIRAEQKRSEAEEALRVSEGLYRELVQTMSEALALTDEKHCITYVNESFCNMFGFTSEEVMSKPLLDLVHEDYQKAMHECMLNPIQGAGVHRYETAWVTKTGEKIYTLTSPKRLFDAELGYVGCLGVFTDITERKKVESREKKHMMELAHVSRVTTLGEMSSQIAHELAQPLAAIAALSAGGVKMIKSGSSDQDEILESLTDINEQSSRAREIVLRLRNFVRNDEMQFQPIELNKLIGTVVHLVEMEARWYSLPVQLDLQGIIQHTQGDRILLEQVVLNLVHNAIEAMQEIDRHKRKLVIRTSNVDEHTLQVAVIDNGSGISEDNLAKLFEPFFTTKSDGMGMGLAITRSIVDAHKGKLTASRNADGGATFCFTLPVIKKEETRGD